MHSVIQPCPDIDDDDDEDYQSDSDADSSEPIVKPHDQSLNTHKTTEIKSKPTQPQQREQQSDVITQKYIPRIPTNSERNTRIMTTAEINALIDKQTNNQHPLINTPFQMSNSQITSFINNCITENHFNTLMKNVKQETPKTNTHYEIQEDISHIEEHGASIFNMTVQQAMRQYPSESDLIAMSAQAEYKQLLTTNDPNKSTVLKLINKDFDTTGKTILPSLDFSKRKVNKATLLLDKWKHRVVAGGHRQNPNLYSKADTSSPTLDHNTLLMFLSVLMREDGMEFATADFPGAYLATDINEEIYMTISASKTNLLLQNQDFQFLKPFIRKNGSVLTQIQRGIYGLKQAGKLWNDKLVSLLQQFGLEQLEGFPCIFKVKTNEGIMFVAVYVDDMMIACNNKVMRNNLMKFLQKEFPKMELNTDLKQSFLGSAIEFNYRNKTISYDNLQYIQELCERYNIKAGSQYPYDKHFLSSPVNDTPFEDITEYRSLVMSIFYVAKRSRFELLFPISYLATFSSKPMQSDYDKAIIILQ